MIPDPEPVDETVQRITQRYAREIAGHLYGLGMLELLEPPRAAFWVPQMPHLVVQDRIYPWETDLHSTSVRVVDPRNWGRAWLYFGADPDREREE